MHRETIDYESLKAYHTTQNELSVEQSRQLWDYRVMIYMKRQKTTQLIAGEHSGMNQAKAFVKSNLRWSHRDQHIETIIREHSVCHSVKTNQQ